MFCTCYTISFSAVILEFASKCPTFGSASRNGVSNNSVFFCFLFFQLLAIIYVYIIFCGHHSQSKDTIKRVIKKHLWNATHGSPVHQLLLLLSGPARRSIHRNYKTITQERFFYLKFSHSFVTQQTVHARVMTSQAETTGAQKFPPAVVDDRRRRYI